MRNNSLEMAKYWWVNRTYRGENLHRCEQLAIQGPFPTHLDVRFARSAWRYSGHGLLCFDSRWEFRVYDGPEKAKLHAGPRCRV